MRHISGITYLSKSAICTRLRHGLRELRSQGVSSGHDRSCSDRRFCCCILLYWRDGLPGPVFVVFFNGDVHHAWIWRYHLKDRLYAATEAVTGSVRIGTVSKNSILSGRWQPLTTILSAGTALLSICNPPHSDERSFTFFHDEHKQANYDQHDTGF